MEPATTSSDLWQEVDPGPVASGRGLWSRQPDPGLPEVSVNSGE
eukprot:CAMPEP_0174341228 /NCGR_PEP_ID=MMETSP0810-20121108/25258_1 /TAXON_ID=73025 ORGANISM="Eutreptiella gymnastica-like, Strain CCMP1594" /NCGR_SAMPLE_ID=MMETSP0810 /ASSEMBLY_ACC=CAM_ASM_000659 /LENGTH=43 /DNA_ID= /DNA_START= /DNA_END= /DNA_ORIENTATION=